MILLKDNNTQQKSVTITGLVITFLITILSFAAVVFFNTDTQIIWAALAYHTIYAGLYWNKKIRASKDGIEFSDEGQR